MTHSATDIFVTTAELDSCLMSAEPVHPTASGRRAKFDVFVKSEYWLKRNGDTMIAFILLCIGLLTAYYMTTKKEW